jgi:hypothetical protein
MHLLAWTIEGFEKPQPLDMIHMEMGEQQVDSGFFRPQGLPQGSDSRTGIEHQQGPILASYLDT